MSRNHMFYEFYQLIVDRILTRSTTKIRIAADIDEPKVILAYVVFEQGILHYIYTKGPLRHLKLATALFKHIGSPIYFTHQTKAVRDILQKHKTSIYKPELIFEGAPHYGTTTQIQT